MTDQQYCDHFNELVRVLEEKKELDDELFGAIFEEKIKPIVRKAFSPYAGNFAYFSQEDVCQDIFIKLWTRCVGAYFMNDKYEKDPAWFLGWCKIVVNNHVTSLLRNRGNFGSDPLDDPDRPAIYSVCTDPSKELILRDVIKHMCSLVVSLPSKAEMRLTWLGVYLPVYVGDVTDKIESNHLFVEKYLSGTLYDLASDVVNEMRDLPFLEDAAQGMDGLMKELDKEIGGARRGDIAMEDLLGDDPLAKISDWVYKINKKLADSLSEEEKAWNT